MMAGSVPAITVFAIATPFGFAARKRLRFCRVVLLVGLVAFLAGQNLLGDQPGILPDRRLDLSGNIGIGLEEDFSVLAALADALAVIGEPGAGFFDDAGFHPEID